MEGTNVVDCMAFSPDGSILASAHTDAAYKDTFVCVWDARERKL